MGMKKSVQDSHRHPSSDIACVASSICDGVWSNYLYYVLGYSFFQPYRGWTNFSSRYQSYIFQGQKLQKKNCETAMEYKVFIRIASNEKESINFSYGALMDSRSAYFSDLPSVITVQFSLIACLEFLTF